MVVAARADDDGTGCGAKTRSGERCPSSAAYRVVDPVCGPLGLCGPHARAARFGAASEARRPLGVRSAFRHSWSSAEDGYLREHPALGAHAAAAHLGRTTAAVRYRRARLRREGRG